MADLYLMFVNIYSDIIDIEFAGSTLPHLCGFIASSIKYCLRKVTLAALTKNQFVPLKGQLYSCRTGTCI